MPECGEQGPWDTTQYVPDTGNVGFHMPKRVLPDPGRNDDKSTSRTLG